MQLIDTHAHIYEVDLQNELSIILQRAQENHVKKSICPI